MKVFLTGATGLIGRALAASLAGDGHEVVALTRRGSAGGWPPGVRPLEGDPAAAGAWQEALARCDACVHLAGEPVAAGRWTAARKARIESSRVESTRLVAQVVEAGGPRVLVSGSAVGYYGSRGDEVLDERSTQGRGFLAGVCGRWEAAAAPAARRARVVLVRSGLVLAREGGALPRLVVPFKLMAGGPLGDGSAWQPWIHLADEIGLLRLALADDKLIGPLDATGPAPVRSRELARAVGAVLHRPSGLPTPALALRLAFGELADEVLLASQRVLPAKALEAGYAFRHPALEPALQDLLGAP